MAGNDEDHVHVLVTTPAGKPAAAAAWPERSCGCGLAPLTSEDTVAQTAAALQTIQAHVELAINGTGSLGEYSSDTCEIAVDGSGTGARLTFAAVRLGNFAARHGRRPLGELLGAVRTLVEATLTRRAVVSLLEARPGANLEPLLSGTGAILRDAVARFARGRPPLPRVPAVPLRLSVSASAIISDARLSGLLLCVSTNVVLGVHGLSAASAGLLTAWFLASGPKGSVRPQFAAGEHWLPLCFPDRDPDRFLFVYFAHADGLAVALVGDRADAFGDCQRLAQRLLRKRNAASVVATDDVAAIGNEPGVIALREAPSESKLVVLSQDPAAIARAKRVSESHAFLAGSRSVNLPWLAFERDPSGGCALVTVPSTAAGGATIEVASALAPEVSTPLAISSAASVASSAVSRHGSAAASLAQRVL